MDPCRILVVEDEAVVAMDIEERLRRLGYEVAGHAVSGEEAISLAASRLPDLVLMDIRLRGAMDGIAAADEMRRRFSLPIVFLTAFSEDETLDRAKRIEPSGFILKPFKDSELKSAIEIAVYKYRAEAQLRRLTRLFDTLSQVNQTIVRSRGSDELLQAVCRVVVEHGGIDLAWIGWVDTTASWIVPVAHFGKGGDRLQALKVDLHEGIAEANGTARAIREDRPFVCREDASGCCPLFSVSQSPEIRHVFRSCGSFPFHEGGRVCGTLNVCTSDPGFLGEREVELFVEVASDISFALDKHNADVEREKAEEALRVSESRYRSVVEDAPMMISTYLPDTTLLFVNDACCGYFGRSREELIGRRFVEWLPESEGKRFQTLIAHLSPEEPSMVWEHEFISSESTQCFHRWTNRAIFDCDGKPFLYQGFGEDITDQKRSRADLQRLATAIDQAGETVLITDARGVIQYVNPAFERTTGYAREEAIGRTPRILKSGQQDEAFYDEIWKSLLAGDVWEGRFTNRRKDGTLFQEEAVISPVFDPEGRITQFVAVKRDVSREVELESRLRQVQKMEAVGQLAGGVAHDFNNMLSPILGYAEMLLNDLHPADNRYDQVAQIKKAAERSRDLTRQLLAFSRKQVLQMRTVVLSEIVNNMEKLLRRTLREDIHLHTIPTSTPCSVTADVGQLEQVLMNLVVNAQDAMPAEGNLTIEVSRVELTEENCAKTPGITPGRYGTLTVRDTGSGMDRETLEHIFEPFYSTKGERGTGLGLATVYGVVKQHRGHILVESEPGRGTTFQVFLPEAEASVSLPGRAQKTPLRVTGHESILVVEDDEMVLRMACTILMRHGYEVLHASSGIEALHLLERHEGPVHLLLTDVVMPEMNGRELCEMLAQRLPGLKVLYMSGYTDDVIACHGLLEEGTYLIHKPFSVHELPARVREVLDS